MRPQLTLLLQTLDGLQLDFDLEVGNNVQQQPPPPVPQQRVNSVIKALPVPQQQHHHPAPPQQHPEDRTKGDLIAEKLKLLASDRSEEGSRGIKKDQEEQDLLSLLGEQQIMFPPQVVDNLSNYMSWEVKEEEVFPS